MYWGLIFSSSAYKQTNYHNTTLPWVYNPRNTLLQSIISFQLFFPEKSPKPKYKHVHLLTVDSK